MMFADCQHADLLSLAAAWVGYHAILTSEKKLTIILLYKNSKFLKISDRSFYFQAPAIWNVPSSLSFSFFAISFSSLTIFFSIPQAAENSHFSSFLSS